MTKKKTMIIIISKFYDMNFALNFFKDLAMKLFQETFLASFKHLELDHNQTSEKNDISNEARWDLNLLSNQAQHEINSRVAVAVSIVSENSRIGDLLGDALTHCFNGINDKVKIINSSICKIFIQNLMEKLLRLEEIPNDGKQISQYLDTIYQLSRGKPAIVVGHIPKLFAYLKGSGEMSPQDQLAAQKVMIILRYAIPFVTTPDVEAMTALELDLVTALNKGSHTVKINYSLLYMPDKSNIFFILNFVFFPRFLIRHFHENEFLYLRSYLDCCSGRPMFMRHCSIHYKKLC